MVGDVEELVGACVRELLGPFVEERTLQGMTGGKMLRTRLAARLAARPGADIRRADLLNACAAVELVHTASLCHDDVVDGGLTRRHTSTLWQSHGRKGAILLGDLLLCAAFRTVARTRPEWVELFAAKLAEVAATEARQELLSLGEEACEADCLARARGTTGPLFAFAARVASGEDETLGAALEEAGYLVGTAYQVGDDLLDTVGRDESAGKTLGTDALRRKPTLAGMGPRGRELSCEHVARLCAEAREALSDWPPAARALEDFLVFDLQPVFDRQIPGLDVRTAAEMSDG